MRMILFPGIPMLLSGTAPSSSQGGDLVASLAFACLIGFLGLRMILLFGPSEEEEDDDAKSGDADAADGHDGGDGDGGGGD